MINQIKKIYCDTSLYGDYFTKIPSKINDTATSESLLVYGFKKPEGIGELQAFGKINYLLFREYQIAEKYPNGEPKAIVNSSYFIPARYLELAVRRIGFRFLALGSLLTLGSFGFAIKTINLLGRHLTKQS